MKSIFLSFFCFTIVNEAAASEAIIWQQELVCDSNSMCRLGAMVVDSKNNEAVILGTSQRSGTMEANCLLWRVDPNGSITDKKSLGQISKYNNLRVRSFGINSTIVSDTGDIVGLNMSADDDFNSASLSITDRKMQLRKIKMSSDHIWSKSSLFLDMTSCKNDNLLFVGKDEVSEKGIVIKTDLSGEVLWKKLFDHGPTNILSSIACAPDGKDYYAVGLSVKMAGKITFAGPATICLLRYDSNGELKASDFFEGGLAPWPTSLPKVVCLPSGIILVVYDRSKNGAETDLYARAYTPELELLYEKQMLKTKETGPPASFDICAAPGNRFVFAGIINFKDLILYECDAEGTILQTVESNESVGGGYVYVDYLDGKIFAAFAKKLQDNEKEGKIKLLAIKPYKAN